MPVSIVDVAKAAGVSHMTVSRVLNRSRGVRPENIAAVMKAVEKLGYVAPLRKPGPKPKANRNQKIKKVLLVIPSHPVQQVDPGKAFLDSPYGQDVFSGIIQVADSHRVDVEVISVVPGGEPIDTQGADGIILLCAAGDPAQSLPGVEADFPLVMMPQRTPFRLRCDCVVPNERMIGELAVEHLLKHGCTRLALVSSDPDEAMPRDLFYAFKETAKHNDVPSHYVGPLTYHANGPDEAPVVDGSPKPLVDQLLALPRMPDGLLMGVDSVNDMYDELRSRGIEPVRKDPRPGKSVVVITPATVKLWMNPVKPMPYLISYVGVAEGEHLVEQLLRRIARPDDPITHLLIAPTVLD